MLRDFSLQRGRSVAWTLFIVAASLAMTNLPLRDAFAAPRAQALSAKTSPVENSPTRILPAIPDEIRQEFNRRDRSIQVRRFRYEGNQSISDGELDEISDPFRGRPLRYSDLEALRTLITGHYVDKGYVNSGARTPSINEDGLATIVISEGTIGEIRVSGLGRLPEFFIEDALGSKNNEALNLFALEEQVRLLRLDPRIDEISLHVDATEILGVADLEVEVESAHPFYTQLAASNHQSPSVAAEHGELRAGHYNVMGWTDHFEIRGRLSEGLREVIADYDVPISPWKTRLIVGGRVLRAEVVEEPFDELNLESEQDGAWLRLEQPIYESLRHRHRLSLEFEWKRSLATIFGEPLDIIFGEFEDPSTLSGRSEAFLLRLRHQYEFRGRRLALSLSNTITRGIDVPGTTLRTPGVSGSEFLAWRGQASGALRLETLDSQLFARLEIQIASLPVLGFEQFPVGGSRSVRGYRESLLVRDNGFAGSIEWRIPLRPVSSESFRLWVFPFFDVGRSWEKQPGNERFEWIHSAGLGSRMELGRHLSVDLVWAKGFQGSQDGLSGDLQDSGFHFRVALKWPG